jgi:hypothetical protein
MIVAIDPIPVIGQTFQTLFPMTLIVVCIFNLCDCWSNLMRFLMLDSYTFADVFDESKVAAGLRILRKCN